MTGNRPAPVWSRHGAIDQAFLRLLPFAAVGAVCDMAYALVFELVFLPALRVPGEPTLSYGQQAGVMMLLAGGLGASVGAMVVWGGWIARFTAVLTPLLVAWAAHALWNDSFTRHGPDPSDHVLYVPILGGSAVCLLLNLVLIATSARRRNPPAGDPGLPQEPISSRT